MPLSHQMYPEERINSAKNPIWMDGLRMVLGLFLFIKGALFLHHLSDMLYLFGPHQLDLLFSAKASRFYSIAHMIGGLMIAIGFLTRLALLCQIPIVLGSMCLVNSNSDRLWEIWNFGYQSLFCRCWCFSW